MESRSRAAEQPVICISHCCCRACSCSKGQSAAAAATPLSADFVAIAKEVVEEAQALQGADELQVGGHEPLRGTGGY